MRWRTEDQRRANTERVVKRRSFIVRQCWHSPVVGAHHWATPTGYLRKRNLNCGCKECRVRYDRAAQKRAVVEVVGAAQPAR